MKKIKLIPYILIITISSLTTFGQDTGAPRDEVITESHDNNDDNDETNYGWIGLIGLIGLAGLLRRDRRPHDHRDEAGRPRV